MPTTDDEKKSGVISVTESIGYFKEPWYINWLLKTISKEFKDCGDIEKAKKFALSKMKKASEDGQDIGNRVDELIKNGMTCASNKDTDEVKNCMQAYKKWIDLYKPKSIIPGNTLYATIDGHKIKGTPDIFVDDVLVDIKCASKISPGYWLQVNMYQYLKDCSLMNKTLSHNTPYGKVAILRLDKVTGSFEYVVKDYDANCVDVWCGMLKGMIYYKQGEDDNGDEL